MDFNKVEDLINYILESERERFENIFYEVRGYKDENSLNNLVALIDKKVLERNAVLFKENIELPYNEDLTKTILRELVNMNLYALEREDIVLTNNEDLNNRIKKALSVVVPYAIEVEKFLNINVTNNFVAKLMLLTYEYVNKVDFNSIPKCVYYGNIKRHDCYFLIILAIIGFDVIYINPSKLDVFKEINNKNFAKTIEDITVCKNIGYDIRLSKGTFVEKIVTSAKKATNELEATLYNGSGVFKPWQFINGKTKSIILSSVIEDIETFIDEPARLRQGFKIEGDTVYIPNFFCKVNGVYDDYKNLVKKIKNSKINLFIKGTNIIDIAKLSREKIFSIPFYLYEDGSINKNEIMKSDIYKLNTLSIEIQNFIIDKIEETLDNKSKFSFEIDNKLKFELIGCVLSMKSDYLNLFSSFDYTSNIPKLILYLNKDESFDKLNSLFLGFLNEVGFDIVILTPSGTNSIERYINNEFISNIRLKDIVLDYDIENALNKEENVGFIKRLFKF